MRQSIPINSVVDRLMPLLLGIATFALCSCGGGSAETDSNSLVEVHGTSPSVAGWSDADILAGDQGTAIGEAYLAATLNSVGTAIVEAPIGNRLVFFESKGPSNAWLQIPNLMSTAPQFGPYLTNNRLSIVVHTSEPESLAEATYDNGWTLRTIAIPRQSSGGSIAIARIVTNGANRALLWTDFINQSSISTFFSAAGGGNRDWDTNSVPPLAYPGSGDGMNFLSSGEFIIVSRDGGSPYGSGLFAYLYGSGTWSTQSLLVNSTASTNRVSCPAIAPLDSRRYALVWLENSPVAGSATHALKDTAWFAYFDGSLGLTTPQEVFSTESAPALVIRNVSKCPQVFGLANGDLTFVWQRGSDLLARRFVAGEFAQDPVSLPIGGINGAAFDSIGAFDGLGNFRVVWTNYQQLLTSEFKANRNAWDDPKVLWTASASTHALAVNERGDAVVAWLASRGPPPPPRMTNEVLIARRFTREAESAP